MQAAETPDLIYTRPQIEVIGVAQQDLYIELVQNVLSDAFYGCQCAHWHEYRSLDFPMRSD